MDQPRYPARHFRLWRLNTLDAKGKPISKTEAARRLGCGRNMILEWEKNGAPHHIGLACRALWRGDKPVRPPPPLPPPLPEPKPEPIRKVRKTDPLKSIRWTKASA